MNSFGIAPKIKKERKERAKIIKNSFEISDIFNNIKDENNILITGQVQSGKTKWIMNIIKEAIIKYHYNLIILIGGYNKKLYEQTHNRLKKEEINKINPQIDQLFKFSVEKWNNNSDEIIWSNSVINILKKSENLKNLNNKIKELYFEPKVLVIDDESDFFSIKNKNNKNDDSETVNNNLKELYQIINKYNDSIYINVTATPYANIINNYDKDFLIQGLYTLPINDEYNGFDYFINKNSNKHFITSQYFFIEDENLKYTRIITFWLLQTISYFNNTNNTISEMIIFEEIEIEEHQKIKSIIQNTLKDKNNYLDVFKEINKLYFESEHIKEYEFERMLNYLIKTQEESLIILNSDYKQEPNKTNYNIKKDYELNIYIGGNLLSRGLTFENLLLEYFNYLPKSVSHDTLLQRCRWFGYRENNQLLDYLKIICEDKTLDELKSCRDCVDFFFNKETKHGSKLDLNLTRENINKIKKSTSDIKKG